MKITAKAPCRVDLAGGTLDLFPLYLFEGGGITVNCAVEVNSYVEISTRIDKQIHIYSQDLNEELTAASLEELPLSGELEFVARIVKFYAPKDIGLDIVTRNEAPKGSGLGASSSLLIALSGALNKLIGDKYTKIQLIDIGANLEAQSIRVPTGKQDYYAALYGGINAIWFEVDYNRIEKLIEAEEALTELEQRLILSFTGAPRFSAITNWDMMKAYIDGKPKTVEAMKVIKSTALAMREALLNKNWAAFANLLDREWQSRRNLSEGVSTPQIEKIISAASSAGAKASKICGAGGGGCMITYCEPTDRIKVEQAIKAAGATLMEFKVAREGLTLKEDY